MERYSVSAVYDILMNGSEDVDELIDIIQVGLPQLPIQKQTYLKLLAQGQTAGYAQHEVGLVGNQTRIKRDVLRELTDAINGDR